MKTTPKHFRDEIQDLLDNGLDARTRAEVERHVEACTECRREFEALRWTKSFVAKQFAAKAAPSELRENILRALEADDGTERTIAFPPGFHLRKLKPIMAWAAALVALGILALILIPKQRTLPQIVARDFRRYQNQKLTLELHTPDVEQMHASFGTHGLPFTPPAFELSAKTYRLVGVRVRSVQS